MIRDLQPDVVRVIMVRRKSYIIEFKLKIVELAMKNGTRSSGQYGKTVYGRETPNNSIIENDSGSISSVEEPAKQE